MGGISRSVSGRICSFLLSFVLVAGPAFQAVPAFASSEPSPDTMVAPLATEGGGHTPSASPEATSTVVRELVDKRTDTVTQYELSDGSIRAEITQLPTRFKDEDGEWVDIETALVPADEPGAVETLATSATVTLGREQPDEVPVTLTGPDFELGIDMLGVAENARIVIGDTTRYLDVAQDADLEYQATRTGIKETVVLKSADAPNIYRFKVSLDGLVVRQTPLGSYGLYHETTDELMYGMSELIVFDSSVNGAGEPAHCPDAKMTVAATPDGDAIVTHEVPRSWLDAPERVFPVMVDPTFEAGKTNTQDTYVSDAAPGTNYHSSAELRCGYPNSSTGRNRAYVRFMWDSSDIPTTAYVTSAQVKVYVFQNDVSGSPLDIARIDQDWTPASVTWNSKVESFTRLGSPTVSGNNKWVSFEVAPTVQQWVKTYSTNKGFQLYQRVDSETAYKRFRSANYSDAALTPRLVVNYSNPECVTGTGVDQTTVREGDTLKVTAQVNTNSPADINLIQVQLRDGLGVARGVFRWSTNAQKPTGAEWEQGKACGGHGGWVTVGTGYGRSNIGAWSATSALTTGGGSNLRVTFSYTVPFGYGNADVTGNYLQTHYSMGPGDDNNVYAMGWATDNDRWVVKHDGPPAVVANATPTGQSAQAQFDATGSSDDFGIVAYEWDFNEDGNHDATGLRPLYTFDGGGLRSYSLTVRDTAGQTNTISKTVFVSPAVGLISPVGTVTPPDLDCMWYYDSTSPQVAYEIEVTTSTAGPVAASTGQVAGDSKVAALPEPEGGWDADAGYRVRMRAASALQDGTGLMWSAWTDSAAFELTHQPVRAAAASAKSRNPVLVFVTGYRNMQREQGGDDEARLDDVDGAYEDGTFNALVSKFGSTHRIVRMPSQEKTVRKELEWKYRKRSMWNKGSIYSNGDRILDYLKANTTVSSSSGVQPYILVGYSKGGLDSRAFLDRTCSTVDGGKKYRDACVGVVQIGSPNYGSSKADIAWGLYWPQFLKKAYKEIKAEKGDTSASNVRARAKKLAKAADPALYGLRPAMWKGKDFNYNRLLKNNASIAYISFGGKYMKPNGEFANSDWVVSIASAHGPSTLRRGAGGTGVLRYGTHGTAKILKRWKVNYPATVQPTLIMCDEYYPSDDPRRNHREGFLHSYSHAIDALNAARPAGSTASYTGEPGASQAQATSAVYVAAMHEIKASSQAEPSAAPDEFQLVAGVSIDDAEEPVVSAIEASGPIVLENLPAGTVVTAQDMEGNDLAVQSVESTEPLDPDDAEALGEFAPDFETVTVSVEETGTYMIEIDSPDEGEALLYELGGPVLECEPPAYVAAGESTIVTMSVSPSGEQDPVTGWSYLADLGEVGASPNDLGAWPDEVAGDGVATMVTPPLAPGEHEFEVQATSNDTEQARAMMTDVVALDVGSVSIGQGLGISERFEAGLIAERIVSVPVEGSEDTTQPVTIEATLVSGSNGESQVVSVDTTLTPGSSQVCTLGVPAASLAGLGDGAVALSEVTVMARDEYLDYVDPGAAAIPLSRVEPIGVGFTNDLDGIELQEVQATVQGDDVTSALTFTVTGEARFNGASVDGVRYSLDDGQTWYEAKAEDGQWGASREEFSMDVAVAEPGPYFVSIRPVSDGADWETGCEVAVVAGAE